MISVAPYRYRACVTLRAPAHAVERRLRVQIPGRVEPIDDQTCTVRLGADSLDLIAQHLAALATLGIELTVEGPPELLNHLGDAGRRLAGLIVAEASG